MVKYVFVAALLIGILAFTKPRSEATTVRSWQSTVGGIDEAVLPLEGLDFTRGVYKAFVGSTTGISLATIRNRYYCDAFGYIEELRLRSAEIQSLSNLPGITSLSHLRKLDLMGNPLQGRIDVSSFT